MNSKNCHCGTKLERKLEVVEHYLFGKKIIVNNVPHLYCPTCNEVEYEEEKRLEMILRDAYRNGNSEVDYV